MPNLPEITKALRAAAEQDRQEREAAQARHEQEFLDQWFWVAQAWNFAILHGDRRPKEPARFFRDGEKHFRKLGAMLRDRGWDKYIPTVIERLKGSTEPLTKAAIVLNECVLAACDKTTKKGEIAAVLAAAANRWPDMQTDLAAGLWQSLSLLDRNGGKWPEPPAPEPREDHTEPEEPKKRTGASVNARMIDLIKDPDTHSWSAQQFADRLGCGKSTIAETPAWKQLRTARESARLEREARKQTKWQSGR